MVLILTQLIHCTNFCWITHSSRFVKVKHGPYTITVDSLYQYLLDNTSLDLCAVLSKAIHGQYTKTVVCDTHSLYTAHKSWALLCYQINIEVGKVYQLSKHAF